jgi:hypothetical protein
MYKKLKNIHWLVWGVLTILLIIILAAYVFLPVCEYIYKNYFEVCTSYGHCEIRPIKEGVRDMLSGKKVEQTRESFCFPEGTQIWTARGARAIESLREGDQLLARDLPHDSLVEVSVLAVSEKQQSEFIVLNSTLEVTPKHPVAILQKTEVIWKEAGKITEGECLVTSAPRCLLVKKVERKNMPRTTVINLSVTKPHNFFVLTGDIPILVHNKSLVVPSQSGR